MVLTQKEINRRQYLKHREKILENHRLYRLNNKEAISEQNRLYYKTPNGLKKRKINDWKCRGIIDEDFSLLYDYLLLQTNCMICLKLFKNSQDRHLDHDHNITDDSNVRYILCRNCNCNFLNSKYDIML